MTKREKVIEALQIAEKADPKGCVWGGHDVFSIGPDDMELTDAQIERLDQLGFMQSSDFGWHCFASG